MRILSYFPLFVLLITLYSCDKRSRTHSEGVIEYKITYPKIEKGHYMLGLMPKKMITKFKDDKYVTKLSAGMGLFKTGFICDKENESYMQLAKLFNKKYVTQLEGDDIYSALEHLPKFHIQHSSDIKKILNYNCKKATITVGEQSDETYTVYYTNELNIEDPNWCNQYAGIDGMLLEYQYEKYGICMRFIAKKITFKKIKDTDFEVPEDYDLIPQEKVDKEITAIFNDLYSN